MVFFRLCFWLAGFNLLLASADPSSGALGLNIYVVMCIAGRRWVPLGALLRVAAALLRTASAWAENPGHLLGISGLLWIGAFLLYAWHMLPIFLAPRPDHGLGCEGVMKN